jgi:hypothetical protein
MNFLILYSQQLLIRLYTLSTLYRSYLKGIRTNIELHYNMTCSCPYGEWKSQVRSRIATYRHSCDKYQNMMSLTVPPVRVRVADVALTVDDGVYARARPVGREVSPRMLHIVWAVVRYDLAFEHAVCHRTEHCWPGVICTNKNHNYNKLLLSLRTKL